MAMFASIVARRFPPTSKTLDVCSNCKDLCRYPAAPTCLRGAVFLYFRSSNVITTWGFTSQSGRRNVRGHSWTLNCFLVEMDSENSYWKVCDK